MIANTVEPAPRPKASRKRPAYPSNQKTKLKALKGKATSQPAKSLPSAARSTKVSQLIELLNSKAGASIDEMMVATGWQQHSVRGFLAGTVKKKLGLDLTSSKIDEAPRRYRIVTRRSR